jgi:hypothetical protein
MLAQANETREGILDDLTPVPDCFFRGYLDLGRLFALDQGKTFFVIRAKAEL